MLIEKYFKIESMNIVKYSFLSNVFYLWVGNLVDLKNLYMLTEDLKTLLRVIKSCEIISIIRWRLY